MLCCEVIFLGTREPRFFWPTLRTISFELFELYLQEWHLLYYHNCSLSSPNQERIVVQDAGRIAIVLARADLPSSLYHKKFYQYTFHWRLTHKFKNHTTLNPYGPTVPVVEYNNHTSALSWVKISLQHRSLDQHLLALMFPFFRNFISRKPYWESVDGSNTFPEPFLRYGYVGWPDSPASNIIKTGTC